MGKQVVRLTRFNHLTPEKHERSLGKVPDGTDTVGNKQITHTRLSLKPAEKRQNLQLNPDIERRQGLIQHYQSGPYRDSTSDGDALPLATAELVRIAQRVRRLEAHLLE